MHMGEFNLYQIKFSTNTFTREYTHISSLLICPLTLTWISCSTERQQGLQQSGWQGNHIKVTSVSLLIKKKKLQAVFNPAITFQHWSDCCSMVQYLYVLQHTQESKEEAAQLCLHAYQRGDFWLLVLLCLARSTQTKLGPASKQNKINKSMRCLLFCYALSHCGMLSLIWDNVVIKSSWFLLCCFDSQTVAEAGAWRESGPEEEDNGKKGVSV